MKHAAAILLCSACAVSFSHAQDEAISISGNHFFRVLDLNNDGRLDPYEALDALSRFEDETGEELTAGNLTRALAELKQQEIDDVSEMFADMRDGHDDQDGQLP